MIYECAWQTFAPLAPAITPPKSPADLHTHLNPETFYFSLNMVEQKVVLVQESSPPPMPPFNLAITDRCILQRYLMRDISILKKFSGIGYIAKALVNGREVCCKIGSTTNGTAVQREYETLLTVSRSKYADSTRVPKLLGLVVDDYGVIGILEELVLSEHTLRKILGIQWLLTEIGGRSGHSRLSRHFTNCMIS